MYLGNNTELAKDYMPVTKDAGQINTIMSY